MGAQLLFLYLKPILKRNLAEKISWCFMIVSNEKIPIIVVVGPTASGKTKLAVELAKAYDGEVNISTEDEHFLIEILLNNK